MWIYYSKTIWGINFILGKIDASHIYLETKKHKINLEYKLNTAESENVQSIFACIK